MISWFWDSEVLNSRKMNCVRNNLAEFMKFWDNQIFEIMRLWNFEIDNMSKFWDFNILMISTWVRVVLGLGFGLGLRRTLCATDLVRNGPRALVPTMAFSKFENLMVSKFWGVVNLKTCAPISQSQNFDYVKISWIPPIGSGHNSFSANLKPQNLKIMRSCQSLNDEIMSISKFLYVKNLRWRKFEMMKIWDDKNLR